MPEAGRPHIIMTLAPKGKRCTPSPSSVVGDQFVPNARSGGLVWRLQEAQAQAAAEAKAAVASGQTEDFQRSNKTSEGSNAE